MVYFIKGLNFLNEASEFIITIAWGHAKTEKNGWEPLKISCTKTWSTFAINHMTYGEQP